MSRIHDALKRAAAERASQTSASSSEILAEVTGPNQQLERREDVLDTAPINGSARSEAQVLFRFEELMRQCAHPKWKLDPRMSVFEGMDSEKIGAEPFRTLRSRLHQIARTRKLKRILITSSVPAEGKSFVAANLAQSIIRKPDHRVLLIDADLRRSHLHVALGAPAIPGLTDYLRGDADEHAIVQSGPDKNLCFIPGGSRAPNPSELLLNEKMSHLLNVVTPMFDFTILDSPPSTLVHDASLLADLCDGVLFVVRAGMTSFELAQRAVAEFKDKNLLGVVLNRVEEKSADVPHYYKY